MAATTMALKSLSASSGVLSLSRRTADNAAELKCTSMVQKFSAVARVARIEKSSLREAIGNVVGEQSRKLEYMAILAANAFVAMPALANEEKGKIFDFNLTLPIIVVQFLLLMVALDNIWFKPVSKVMDARDEEIRKKLSGVRDNSDEIKALQAEAESIIKAARAETAATLSQMKRETAAALDAKLQESRERIEKELEQALSNLETQKQETLRSLDAQVAALSDEIIRKVVPFKI
eukprot:TRINITY_DN606_c0_g1_i1.p1 TRINITY_DN606_c0_g1~~TRINITY_DN606_c0_g1_i1.p1  ORF type:complete len:262 (-),score=78.55 TRINITY_DN606_c0_g1_i1:365-1069(-)